MTTGAELVTIDPSTAARWLRVNARNRPKSPYIVRVYGHAMVQGRWIGRNGETIKFSSNGELVDGQHRLQASVDFNVSFQSWVIWDVDPDSFDTIDVGKKRTTSDILAIANVKFPTQAGAAVRWIDSIRTNTYWRHVRSKMADDEVRAFAVQHYDAMQTSLGTALAAKDIINVPLGAALHYSFAERDNEAADLFFEDLAQGNHLESNDPVWLLRERLQKEKGNKRGFAPSEACAVSIRAWNLRRRGETAVILKGSLAMRDADGGKRLLYPEII